jgi:hypothetical protein
LERQLAAIDIEELFDLPIAWEVKDANAYLLFARVGDKEYLLRINDFPDEPAYTLIVDGEELQSFDDRPANWIHPPLRR